MASAPTTLSQNQALMHEMLHLLSQPLTTLHCALEHSLTQDAAERAGEVALALEQTDRVIAAVRLMREYLEAEEGCFVAPPFPLGLATENVLEQLSVLAEARGAHLFAAGTSTAAIPVRNAWLQRALFYLLGALIEGCSAGQAITILLEDAGSSSVISGHNLPASDAPDDPPPPASKPAPDSNTLWQVKLEIARRVLESSGASVELYSGAKPGFIIRLPHRRAPSQEIPV